MKLFHMAKNCNLIIKHFPTNYQELTYIEPCCGTGTLLTKKKPSKEEVINDLEEDVVTKFRNLRDRPNYFFKKADKDEIKRISNRLEDVYILHNLPATVIKAFNDSNSFLFIDLQNNDIPMDKKIDMTNQLKEFKGKVIFTSMPSNLYNQAFKSWECIKKSDLYLRMNY